VIYDRVSDDRAHGRSVSEQEAENRRVVERHGWELAGVFTDNSVGASRYSRGRRDDWQRLVGALERGEADVLVTWEASRSTRDLEAYVDLRDVCRRTGVQWCYNGRLFDLRRGDDAFQTGLDILLAEKEVEQTRERVMRAVRANAVAGRPHGKLLFGYRREYENGRFVRQVIREDQAAIVREMAARFLAGEACYSIAGDFNDRGIPAPRGGTWTLSQIRRTILNPGYAGLRVHQGAVIGPAEWPAILDDSTYYACQIKFADPARKTVKDSHTKHLLTGVATCGVCGGPTTTTKQRGGYRIYTCKRKFCTARKQEWVDDLITRLIIARLSQPDAYELFQTPDNHEALNSLAARRARLNEFYDAAAKGDITAAALGRVESALLREIADLERQVRVSVFPDAVYDVAQDAEAVWQTLSLRQRREVVRWLVDIRLLPIGRTGRREFDPAGVAVTWRVSVAEPQPARA